MANNNNKPKQNQPFYLNRSLWVTLILSLALVLAGTSVAFGPDVVIKFILEPTTYAIIALLVTGIGGIAAAVIKVLASLKEELIKLREKTEKTTAETAKVKEVANTANERADLLETRNEQLSSGYYGLKMLIDEGQEERKSYRVELDETKKELWEVIRKHQTDREEIAALNRKLSEVTRESESDKKELNVLRNRVTELETENKFLKEEIRELQDSRADTREERGGYTLHE